MIGTMLKPFFKKFFGLFVSMVFVSLLSIGLLCCFGSVITNLRHTYENYLENYGMIDEQVTTSYMKRSKLISYTEGIEEIEAVDARLTMDCYLKKEDRTIVARIFSYNENENQIFGRYVSKSVPIDQDKVNVSIASKYALNNNFKAGDTIQLGFLNYYTDFYVCEIVETAEGIYPRANDYVWSDNSDFGYIYVAESELDRFLIQMLDRLEKEYGTIDEAMEELRKMASDVIGINIPDLISIDEIIRQDGKHYADEIANQILVRNIKGSDENVVLEKIKANMMEGGTEYKSATIGSYLPYRLYMNHAIEQLQIATTFLPVFFYSVTMVVIGLFMNQIVKTMTPQIGVMVSIGIDKRHIILLFLVFSFFMSITAGILGGPLGYVLQIAMVNIMRNAYALPMIPYTMNPIIVAVAIGLLVIFAALATFFSCLAIFRITPKDAVISNEAKRKPLPKWLSKAIDKAPMNIKLGTNAIVQNPRRHFVSTFSIFASLVLILLSTFFYVSKEEMIKQSVDRRLNYDAQVYLTEKETDQDFIDDFKMQSFIEKDQNNNPKFEDCYYTYLASKTPSGDDLYMECLAIDENSKSGLINIPSSNGRKTTYIKEEGIVLTKGAAESLKVKKGDKIKINDIEITVTDISFQYFHPIAYLSKTQMDRLGVQYVTSFIVDINNDQAFLDYLSANRQQCLTVFTKQLSKDLHGIFDSINVFIYIMVGFSLGMSFVILAIMSQNALMEQQRQLTILRAIGFTILDISNFWTLQSASQLLSSSLFGVPAGALVTIILLKLCSSTTQIYPFILSWPVIFMAIGFVFLVILACHLLAMISIKKWNIANNTRSRE